MKDGKPEKIVGDPDCPTSIDYYEPMIEDFKARVGN
jgi:hypothetical protein